MSIAPRRPRAAVAPFLAVLATLFLAAPAAAADETFERFEAVATANYAVDETCADGSTARTLVTVIGGHEQEAENGVQTLDNEFLTILLRGFDCAGNLVNDRGSGQGEFTFQRGLKRATVTGTIVTRDGRTVTADVAWEGVGPVEITTNTTRFPGFKGHFTGKERDAVATGTVVVNGSTLVDGTTTNARIETLEDRNRTTS
jgi:hypothetical protein